RVLETVDAAVRVLEVVGARAVVAEVDAETGGRGPRPVLVNRVRTDAVPVGRAEAEYGDAITVVEGDRVSAERVPDAAVRGVAEVDAAEGRARDAVAERPDARRVRADQVPLEAHVTRGGDGHAQIPVAGDDVAIAGEGPSDLDVRRVADRDPGVFVRNRSHA